MQMGVVRGAEERGRPRPRGSQWWSGPSRDAAPPSEPVDKYMVLLCHKMKKLEPIGSSSPRNWEISSASSTLKTR